jgi:hypothetical protein
LSEKRALRKILAPKTEKKQITGENFRKRNCMICTPHQILLGR